MACEQCGGSGVVRTEDGFAGICSCRRRDSLRSYLRPDAGLRRGQGEGPGGASEGEAAERGDSQAILRNDKNIVSLIKMMSTAWMPAEYRIVSVADLNAIEFGKWSEYKSTHDLMMACRHLVIDARFCRKRP